jgi:hypothetical protein
LTEILHFDKTNVIIVWPFACAFGVSFEMSSLTFSNDSCMEAAGNQAGVVNGNQYIKDFWPF